jgi:6-phosphofructokinase
MSRVTVLATVHRGGALLPSIGLYGTRMGAFAAEVLLAGRAASWWR